VNVLVDTSVWIRFLAKQRSVLAPLDTLLAQDRVFGHDLIYGELLIGDLGGRAKLLRAYRQIHQSEMLAHIEVVEFVRARRLQGHGIGWIDAHLLGSALVSHCMLWTADSALREAAQRVGVCYSPGVSDA
jgi:predicted nucleic acid-binding protein